MNRERLALAFICIMLMFCLVSCGSAQDTIFPTAEADGSIVDDACAPVYDHHMELDYAKEFAVDYYTGGYALITIEGSGQFLVIPEGLSAPESLDGEELGENITVIAQPVQNIYLAASAIMDMFCAMDASDAISLSGIKAEDWYVEEAKLDMEAGEITYAGKYNAPDYEKILDSQCSLAIESTMILHSPEVKENLEDFGIPVLVDRSSYEEHPLGRTEWVKLYGVLLGEEERAVQAFETQKAALDEAASGEGTGKTVAFFYITSNGMANVRKSGDYVPRMIELAGGRYIFSGLGDDTSASSTVNMQIEEFYAEAKDADYLIYNGTVDGGVSSVEELLDKCPLLGDFKAVKAGRIFCTTKNLYQDSMELGTIIMDIHAMLTMEEDSDETLTHLFRLE